jgi:hypothetical protein
MYSHLEQKDGSKGDFYELIMGRVFLSARLLRIPGLTFQMLSEVFGSQEDVKAAQCRIFGQER